ncbi:hypothetical protein HDU67_008794 [Dinochytrium kinnereticum]|nr:hypothetical protein HDU67_008794 [Dinochytrium kinnereticum]
MAEDEEPPLRGRWSPLPKDSVWHGVVTCSFNPTSILASAASTTVDAPDLPPPTLLTADQYIAIELGDNVQLLEEFWQPPRNALEIKVGTDRRGSHAGRSGEAAEGSVVVNGSWGVNWYRGYVFPSQLESSPKLGVFPASHIYCRSLVPYRKSTKYSPNRSASTVSRHGKDDTNIPIGRHNTALVKTAPESVERSSKLRQSTSRSGSVSGFHPILSATENSSIFPPIPLSIRPTHETASGVHEPLADEISAALREWGALLKRHVALQDYALFSTVKNLFHLLFQGRRQLLSQTLSQEELIKYRRTLVAKLETGNIAQGLDLIVRHPEKGHLVGEKSPSIVKLLKMHMQHTASGSALTNLIGNGTTSSSTPAPGSNANLISSLSASKDRMDVNDTLRSKNVHMNFQLKSFRASICLPGEFAELSFFLYSKAEGKAISEEFLVCINYNGYPRGMEDGLARLKSTFTDLSQKDLVENIFLICRVVRVGKMNVSDKDTASAGLASSFKSGGGNLNSMGSFSSLEGFSGLRRPFGCAVLDLCDLHSSATAAGLFGASASAATSLNALSGISSLQNEGSSPPRDYLMRLCVFPSEGAFSSFYNEAAFPTLHETIVNKGTGYETLPSSDLTVTLSLGCFPSGGANANAIRDLDVFSKTSRLGLPEMIYPYDVRNSLYLTLVSGEFTSRTTLLSARNVQISVQVRLSDGTIVPDCIYRGAGYRETLYESVVYYHSNSPRWVETIRIDLEPEVLERSHLYFSIRHCSSSTSATSKEASDKNDKTFAFGFLPLLRADHTVINDASHLLSLYKYDRKIATPGVYLSYQAGPNIISSAGMSNGADGLNAAAEAMARAPALKDSLVVKTALFSSRMTQTASILNLLHWRHATTHLLVPVDHMLKEFFNIPDFELVKFLDPVLMSLFDILESQEVNGDGRLDDLVFSCMVFLLSIVVDRRFAGHGVIVDSLIERWTGSARLSRSILNSFNKLIANPGGKELRDAIKVWGYWIRFVVKSGLAEQRGLIQIAPSVKNLHGGKMFIALLKETLNAIESLMGSSVPEAIASQTLALQHFPQLLPDLAKIHGPIELVDVVVKFADSVRSAKTKLNGHKLAFIHTLIRGPLFADRRSRLGIIAASSRWISEYLSGDWDRDRSSFPMGQSAFLKDSLRSKSHLMRTSDKDNLRLCLNVATELIDRLQKVGDRLDRGKSDEPKTPGGDASSAATKEEEYKKCLQYVANVLPIILETYTEFATVMEPELSTVPPSLHYGTAQNRWRSEKNILDDFLRNGGQPNSNGLSINTSSLRTSGFTSSPISPLQASATTSGPSTTTSVSPPEQSSAHIYSPPVPELAELGGLILAALNLLPQASIVSLLYRKGSGSSHSGTHIITLLYVILQSLMRGDAFPQSWVAMHIITNRMVVKVLRPVSEVLTSDEMLYSDGFDEDNGLVMLKRDSASPASSGIQWPPRRLQLLWSDFLRILLQLLNSRWLSVETFPPQRARVSQRLGGDVRGEAGELLRDMWEFLTGVEKSSKGLMTFIPNLVGPFLELTLSPHPKLRVAAVELLFSTMEREHRASGEFSRIEMECIDRMDRLIVFEGKGEDSYRRFVIEALGKQFTTATKNSVVAAVIESSGPSNLGHAVSAGKRPSSGGGSEVAVATSLAASGARFLSAFDTFLDLLIAARDTPSGSRFDDERIAAILKLIRFLRDIGRKALYVKYVHALARLHLSVGNNLEAALTLKLHADLLPWSLSIHVDPVPEYGFPKWQTSFERKEQIYINCIELFEQSNHWERSVALCSELAAQYAKGWLDYMKHADYLKRQARFVENILQQERYHPTYYRVGFYGRGFSSSLRNKQFIYRAGEWEKLGPFCERILNKYVGAQLLRTNAMPGDDVINGNGSWVQITSVNPEIDVRRWGSGEVGGAWIRWESPMTEPESNQSTSSVPEGRVAERHASVAASTVDSLSQPAPTEITYIVEPDLDPKPDGAFARAQTILDKLPESIRSYYLSNEVDMFSFSRPFRKPVPSAPKNDPATEFLELWTEKTLLITGDSFPCLDRRSEVIRSYVIELSPIENAVITVRAKNRQLLGLEKKYEAPALTQIGSSTANMMQSGSAPKRSSGSALSSNTANFPSPASRNVNLFTMALNGAVDAPVNGGVPMYRKAFLNGQYKKDNPSSVVYIEMLEKSIDEQVEIIQRCLAIHDIIVPPQMRPLHENIVQTFHKDFPSEISRLSAKKSGMSHSKPFSKEAFSAKQRRPSDIVFDTSPQGCGSITPSTAASAISGIGIGALYSTFGGSGTNLSSVMAPGGTGHPIPAASGSPSNQSTVRSTRVLSGGAMPSGNVPSGVNIRPRRDSSGTYGPGHFGSIGFGGASGVVGNFAFSTSSMLDSASSSNIGNSGGGRDLSSPAADKSNHKRISMSSLKSNESRTSLGSLNGDSSSLSQAAKMVGGIQKLLEKW